jgi:hypothetical protein
VIRDKALLVAASLLGLFAAGCNPQFQALTTPPPFTEAELCDGAPECGGGHTITLTKGIALAFECLSSEGQPCTRAEGLVDNPVVAKVYDGYLTSLSEAYHDNSGDGTRGAQPRSALVILAREVGQTKLRIHSDAGSMDFDVFVHDF